MVSDTNGDLAHLEAALLQQLGGHAHAPSGEIRLMPHGRYIDWAPKPLVAVDIFRVVMESSSSIGM